MLRWIVSACLICIATGQAIGEGASPGAGFDYYTPDTYPDSLKDYRTCGLSQPGYVCDPNGLLGVGIPNRADGLDILVRQILRETNCSCADQSQCHPDHRGFTVSVALLKHIHTDGSTTELDPAIRHRLISNFANALRYKQRRGKCDDDVLIVLSSSEAAIFTALSNTTAATFLNAETVDSINADAYDSFSEGKFTMATGKLLNGYKNALKGIPRETNTHWYSPLPTWAVYAIAVGLFLIVVGIIVAIIVCLRLRSRRREYTPARQTDSRYDVQRL